MAELQQSVVGDSDTRQQLANQVVQWEENLERLHCEQFRLRCYMASLQSGELPNPKVCLARTFNIWQKKYLFLSFSIIFPQRKISCQKQKLILKMNSYIFLCRC